MFKEFMISRDGQQYGPYSTEDLLQYLKDGKVDLGDFVWSEGMDKWKRLKEVENELSSNMDDSQPTGGVTVIPERIRKNLAKYKEHSHLTCLECGYVGLAGHVRVHKEYRKIIVIIVILLCVLGVAAIFLSQLQMAMGAATNQIGYWFFGVPAILLGGLFGKKETIIIQCPNCEKELAKK